MPEGGGGVGNGNVFRQPGNRGMSRMPLARIFCLAPPAYFGYANAPVSSHYLLFLCLPDCLYVCLSDVVVFAAVVVVNLFLPYLNFFFLQIFEFAVDSEVK